EFLQAMTGVSRGANMAMAQKLPWAEYRSFVDAGTAQGDLAVQIAAAHPHLSGVGFDLPQVGPIFEEYADAQGVGERLSFVGGSFFEEELPKADVVLMGHILHDWDLAEKKELVRKAYEALPESGLFVMYDALIDDARRERTFGLLMSLNMLVETHGGFDYTEGEGTEWMLEAGFKEARVEHLVGPDYIVVGTK
ncbi:MAG: methyltransferase, partial [Verrucomicrobiota bacterium]